MVEMSILANVSHLHLDHIDVFQDIIKLTILFLILGFLLKNNEFGYQLLISDQLLANNYSDVLVVFGYNHRHYLVWLPSCGLLNIQIDLKGLRVTCLIEEQELSALRNYE